MLKFNHVGFGLGKTIPITEQVTRPDGTRVYETPDGRRYPSVTTVLSEHGREAIEAWRKRIGAEEALKLDKELQLVAPRFIPIPRHI